MFTSMEISAEQEIKDKPEKKKFSGNDALPQSNAYLPEEIQIDILSRLSPTSLSKCKCVSKHWNISLTMKAFLLRHSCSYAKLSNLVFVASSTIWEKNSVLSFELTDRNTNTPKTMTMTIAKATTMTITVGELSFTTPGTIGSIEEIVRGQHVSFPDAVMSKYTRMSNICNDLVCLFNQSSTSFCLLNIKTQDFFDLPPVTVKWVGAGRFWCSIGFDPIQKVFKILSIITVADNERKMCHSKAAILTLGSKYWKPIDDDWVPCSVSENWVDWTSTNSLCFDGVIYWVHYNGTHEASILTVVAFDLSRESFRDFKLLVRPINESFRYYLTSLKGCPTLFSWQMEADQILQWTLPNHKDPSALWCNRSFISDVFSRMLPNEHAVAGGSILLQHAKPARFSLQPVQNESKYSLYSWYDLENFAVG